MAVTTIRLANLINDMITLQIQDAENGFYEIYGNLDIDNSELQQLLSMAELVGQAQLSTNDLDTLRGLIKGKIYQNASKGSYEDVYNASLAVTLGTNVILDEIYPCGIEVYTDGTVPAGLTSYVLELIDGTAAAGVEVGVVKPIYGDGMFWLAPADGVAIYNNTELGTGILGTAIAEKEI